MLIKHVPPTAYLFALQLVKEGHPDPGHRSVALRARRWHDLGADWARGHPHTVAVCRAVRCRFFLAVVLMSSALSGPHSGKLLLGKHNLIVVRLCSLFVYSTFNLPAG